MGVYLGELWKNLYILWWVVADDLTFLKGKFTYMKMVYLSKLKKIGPSCYRWSGLWETVTSKWAMDATDGRHWVKIRAPFGFHQMLMSSCLRPPWRESFCSWWTCPAESSSNLYQFFSSSLGIENSWCFFLNVLLWFCGFSWWIFFGSCGELHKPLWQVRALGPWVQDLIILLTRWKLNWDLMALEKVNFFFCGKKWTGYFWVSSSSKWVCEHCSGESTWAMKKGPRLLLIPSYVGMIS